MQRHCFNNIQIASVVLLSVLLCSCSDYKQKKYVAQFKSTLPIYDSLTSVLVAKYLNYSLTSYTIICPSEEERFGNGITLFDTSINNFCNQNDISYIEVRKGLTDSAITVTYFLSDNHYQYVFEKIGTIHNENFENTRVEIIPINNKWVFQYEKPNF